MKKSVSLDYQLIIEKLPDGFAYHQIVKKKGVGSLLLVFLGWGKARP